LNGQGSKITSFQFEEITKMVFRRFPGLWRMHRKPLAEILFLFRQEKLFDLVRSALERVQEAHMLMDIKHRGPDIHIRKGRRFLVRPFTLDPHREKLFEDQASAIQRRFRIVEELILGLA